MKAAMLEDADTGCAQICGNQSFSMTSTWSRVFRYFSLQTRAIEIQVRWSRSILQRHDWNVVTLHTDDPLNDEAMSPLC